MLLGAPRVTSVNMQILNYFQLMQTLSSNINSTVKEIPRLFYAYFWRYLVKESVPNEQNKFILTHCYVHIIIIWAAVIMDEERACANQYQGNKVANIK
jgi:hypothetical protein